MRALVTGGAGFIGSTLVDLLLSRGWNVDVVDDLSTGFAGNLPPERFPVTRYHFVSVANAYDTGLLEEWITQCDVVFHLAAVVGVSRVLEHPVAAIASNQTATYSVLSLASYTNKPVVIASSSEVYGDTISNLTNESCILQIAPGVRWGYAAAKLADEFLALAYYHEHQLPVVVARIFNTIGPRQVGDYGMVVPRFIDQAITGEPISVYGFGHQRRSFTWVGDTVRALADLAQCQAAYGQIVNVGSEMQVSIMELAQLIKHATCSNSDIAHLSYEQGYGVKFWDIQRRVPNLTKFQSLLGWKPTMSLAEMIDRILQSRGLTRAVPFTGG